MFFVQQSKFNAVQRDNKIKQIIFKKYIYICTRKQAERLLK